MRHSIARVHGKIDDDLLKLCRIGLHKPQVTLMADIKLDALPKQAL